MKEQVSIRAANSGTNAISKLRIICRTRARELGHDPSVFQFRRGRSRSICKKCMASMELISEDNMVIGPMLRDKCTGQSFFRL